MSSKWKDKAADHTDRTESKGFRQKIPPVKLQDMITALEDFETQWTQWETSFIQNIQERMNNEWHITDAQCDKMQEIHDRYFKKEIVKVKDKPRYNM